MDLRVTRLAKRQHGVVGRRQVLAAGLTKGQVEGLVHRQLLVPASNGVYVVPGSPTTVRQEAMVAALRCGPDARIGGALGLSLAGVDHLDPSDGFTVLLRRGRRARNVPWRLRHNQWPDLGMRASGDGVPTYGIARNLLEAAADATTDETVLETVDAVRWMPRSHMDRVRRLAVAAPRHPGVRRLQTLGAFECDAPESPPERWLVDLLHDFRPRTQVEVAPGLRVDVLIPDARLVLEYDGRATHSGSWAAERDGSRDRRLRALGYLVLHVTAADRRDPGPLLARIRAIVDAAGG